MNAPIRELPEKELMYFNGVNAVTGQYVVPPMNAQEVALLGLGQRIDEKELNALRARLRLRQPIFGVIEGVDPRKLEETGWGVIFAAGADPKVRDALKPLLDRRKSQAGDRYQEYADERAYRHAPQPESKWQYLARLKVPTSGAVDPEKMPYYLLIVGDPETIPYSFQYQMDVAYAVGRIHFDTLEEYARYAESVVEAETGQSKRPRQAAFFGVQNQEDWATYYSVTQLVIPLADFVTQDQPSWTVRTLLKEETRKDQLARLLGGMEAPALLFTASHGMRFPGDDPKQVDQQGALLCQEWPGPLSGINPIPEDHYYSAQDVSDNANLSGMITFHFACYGAGTPRKNDFYRFDQFYTPSASPIIENAPQSFVARLPQRLLGHPNGGALAVVAHVDRSFGYSFMGDDQYGKPMQVAQLGDYRSMLKQLMEGYPIGSALEFFNERYAEVASDLQNLQNDIDNGLQFEAWQFVSMWTTNNDSRNFIIVGDPAVRLMA